jgi:hypothetical protein
MALWSWPQNSKSATLNPNIFKFSNQMNSFSVSNESDLVVLLLLSYFGILGSK